MVLINTSVEDIPLIWKNQLNKNRLQFTSFDSYENVYLLDTKNPALSWDLSVLL